MNKDLSAEHRLTCFHYDIYVSKTDSKSNRFPLSAFRAEAELEASGVIEGEAGRGRRTTG